MNNGSGSKNRWIMGLHLKGRKERENEDLHLFRELHKREKERTACLLLPVDDLEHSNGGTYNSMISTPKPFLVLLTFSISL